MADKENVPDAAIDLLTDGRKVEAIKLIRRENGLGLKAAKNLVEDYMLANPDRFPNDGESSGGMRGLVIGLVVLAALLTYQFVS